MNPYKIEDNDSLGKSLTKIFAQGILEYILAWALLLGLGFAASKYYDRKQRKSKK